MVSTPRVAVVGNVAYVAVEGLGTSLGGGALNVAAGANLAGVRCEIVSSVGSDLTKAEHHTMSRVANTSRIAIQEETTCAFSYSYGGDASEPAVSCDFGASVHLTDHALAQDFGQQWVHVCSRFPLDAGRVLKHLEEQPVAGLSLDFVYSSVKAQLETIGAGLLAANVIFLNNLEAKLAKPFLETVDFQGLVVVTNGARGCRIWQGGVVLYEFAPSPVGEIVDPTGAGDTFAGGFIAHFVQGQSLAIATQSAHDGAVRSLQGLGVDALLGDTVSFDRKRGGQWGLK